MPEKTICPTCGYPITDALETCPNCGENLTVHVVLPEKEAESTAIRKPITRFAPSNFLFIGVAILFASLVFAIYAENREIMSGGQTHTPDDGHNHEHSQPLVDPKVIEEVQAKVHANPSDMDALLQLANLLHDAQRPQEAIIAYEKYLGKHPDNPDARIDLGVCYFDLKMYEDAVREIETALNAHPKHQLGQFNLGVVYLNKGESAKALKQFEKAIALNPANQVGKNASAIAQQILESSQ